MTSLENFKVVQRHNHLIMHRVTELEKEAFKSIANGDFAHYSELLEEIDRLQKTYMSYRRTNKRTIARSIRSKRGERL